jgi:FixJ family two-component response regulator
MDSTNGVEHKRREAKPLSEILDGQPLITPQIAEYLQVSERTVANYRAEGMPHIKITARRCLYRRSDVDKWLAKKKP